MSGGGGTAPTPTLNALEQAAQLFTDYYEGEVSVKPSDLRAYQATWNENGDIICGIVPVNFDSSPWPIVLVKNSTDQVCTMTLDESSRPFIVNGIEILPDTEPNPIGVDAFMEQQTLANNGFLMVGWVDGDNSLLNMQMHPSWN